MAYHAALQQRAHQRRHHKSHRHTGQQIPVKGAGQVLAKQGLHHIGGIGAHHHQLAVRHIDHTHEAIGNRQAQRHQQQDRAQADTAKNRAQAVAPGQAFLHRYQAFAQSLAHLGIRLRGQAFLQQGLCGRLGAGAQQFGSGQALGRVFAAQQGRCAQQVQAIADVAIALFGNRVVNQGQLRLAHLALQGLDGSAAHGGIWAEQLQSGQSVVYLATQAVVHHRVFGGLKRVGGNG